ncbi:MAG: hypothetical protein A2W91_10665 [Bacteroidetes bacterium GWF2_38_335]|nr:MAG: hypothetical protein A2W91_10665 [Bacteroidetes bacterium GWF2_38_335]OFY81836.1 MAG: hypothetical protein A2281_06375 [Bacteroidetes bacterium RIFOXYA12_FULL_38_20]HBS87909.1 serine hydrolase [Bacteroidales bacterium]
MKLIIILFSALIIFSCSEEKVNFVRKIYYNDTSRFVIESLNIKEKQALFEFYFDSLYNYQAFNGNVLIAQHGIIIYEKCFGMADFKKNEQLTIHHSFQLASVSKQFTAACILQLVEKGEISLGDTIQKFFPDFPYHNITIHLLLCHRSGLPNYIYFMDDIIPDKTTKISNQTVLDSITKHKPDPYYPPDITFDYSNTGYIILAAIVEQVSGMKYNEYLEKNIFKPLEMSNSYTENSVKHNYKPSTGYKYGKSEADDNFIDGVIGDKGIYSSVYDLYKWDRALHEHKILSEKMIDLSLQPYGKNEESDENYGYGWRMYKSELGFNVYFHGGWWHGFHNMFVRVPEKDWTIIILKNRKTHQVVSHTEMFEILMK